MADSSPGPSHCGTKAAGWLAGGHPAQFDGQVTRTVNFAWYSQDARWSAEVAVVNCGEFFIYRLPDTPVCDLGFCGV